MNRVSSQGLRRLLRLRLLLSRQRLILPRPHLRLRRFFPRQRTSLPHERSEVLHAAWVASRCATLLRGGVPGEHVFRLLATEPEAGDVVRSIAERSSTGTPAAAALAAGDTPAWRVLAASWHLATLTGAPLAAALDRIAAALHALQQLADRRTVLTTGPRTTIKLIAALPLLALGLGSLLGFDPFPVLFTPGGALLLSVGGALLAAGVIWARRMVQALAADDHVAGLECDLVWVALGGGAAPEEAIRRTFAAVDRFGVEWVKFASFTESAPVRRVCATAARVGVATGPLLREEAAALRDAQHTGLEQQAEKLGVRILIPIASCILPSFIVLGVVPVVVAMLGGGSW